MQGHLEAFWAWSSSDWPVGRVPDHEMGVFDHFVGKEAEPKVSASG